MISFQIDHERYAVDAKYVVEIVPLLEFKSVPQAPEYVAGMFNFHETAVPVIDLGLLLQKHASQPYLSSRIILLDYGRVCGEAAGKRILGLLAERVTEVIERPPAAAPTPVKMAGTPYMGDVFFHDGGVSQRLKPAELLPAELRGLLFSAAAEQMA